jgi:hypothetical protein
MYIGATRELNEGRTAYQLSVKDVPVDGFWSVSVYNAVGYFEKNDRAPIPSTASPPGRTPTGASPSSSAGCDDGVANCLPRAGTIWCGSTGHEPRREITAGPSRRPSL